MKLQDFLIGIGLFALFTVVIFSAINTNNPEGLYSEGYLNITHDAETSEAITNITTVGTSTSSDFNTVKGDMGNFSSGSAEPSETSLVGSALKVLINIPKSYRPVANVLMVIEDKFGIPPQFTEWLIGAVIIIIILILIGSFLKNKLSD